MSLSEWVHAEKLMIAHVAINPGQGMFWVAKDSGIRAKYGFTADIVLVPGTPRTVQALIAGDLDYAELDQIGAPKSQSPAAFLNTTFLDELKNNGFVDKLYQ